MVGVECCTGDSFRSKVEAYFSKAYKVCACEPFFIFTFMLLRFLCFLRFLCWSVLVWDHRVFTRVGPNVYQSWFTSLIQEF